MAKKYLYLASPDGIAATSDIAAKYCNLLRAQAGNVAIFRPLVTEQDTTTAALLSKAELNQSLDETVGVTVPQAQADRETALATIIEKFGVLAAKFDAILVVGSDFAETTGALELDLNAVVAANLNLPVVTVLGGVERDADRIAKLAITCKQAFAARKVTMIGTVVDEVATDQLAVLDTKLADITPMVHTVRPADPNEERLCTGPQALMSAIDADRVQLCTPRMFEYQLMAKARADKRTIVLPEAEDKRILEAASIILARDVANVVLLGEPEKVQADAAALGFDISGAKIQSMNDPEMVQKFSATYAELRAKKGVTIEQAREKMTDPSYFGTMMVHLGLADGMVSGATHTTANTIRPALEFIKTKPGTKVVSGSFLMCMADEVLVFADCAVNPNPSPEQLADIAASTAATAKAFGVETKVAMLSYSTGTSGAGPDVDAVREATEIITASQPDFDVAGPIQFDAAIDPTVGQQKMPGSAVAGHAKVFIFPDLNTGNNTYKAVQRTAGAVAIGPVLQGLNKPVNDLSRGALVADIVNTVAITAIQAQA